MSIKKILKWIGIILYVCLIAFGLIIFIYELFTGDEGAFVLLAFLLSIGAIAVLVQISIDMNNFYKINYNITCHQIVKLLCGLGVACGLLIGLCSFSVIMIVFEDFDFSLNNASFIFTTVLYLIFIAYAFFSLMFGQNNSIFIVRALLSITILYTLGISFDNVLYDITSNDKLTSYEDAFRYLLWMFLAVAVISLSVKGLLITFGEEAQEFFPKEERTVRTFDIFLTLFVVSVLVIYRFLGTKIIDVNFLFYGENTNF